VRNDRKTKVKLAGMVWKPVKKCEIGTLRAKCRQTNETTIEMLVPKGLGLGAWDVLITFKDRNEEPLLFQGGLWVGKKPKKKPKPPPEKDKKGKKKQEDKGKTEGKGKAGADKEPDEKTGVQPPGTKDPAVEEEPQDPEVTPEPLEPEEPAP
jgi:hypothetical protein